MSKFLLFGFQHDIPRSAAQISLQLTVDKQKQTFWRQSTKKKQFYLDLSICRHMF